MFPARHRAKARHAARQLSGKVTRTAVVATVVTATAVTTGVVTGAADAGLDPTPDAVVAAIGAADREALAASREERVSRSERRVSLQPQPTDHEFATADLNIWTEPREQGKRLGLLEWGARVAVTGQVVGHWSEVLLRRDGRQVARWVNNDFLAERKPKPEKSGAAAQPALGGACTNGTSVPSGVSPNIVAVHAAVCAAFPEITVYGTFRSDGEHAQGLAIDIMVSGDRGWEVAEFVRANYADLGVSYVIYSQSIWSVDRSGEGWRGMEDRGSTTANHYDHVHVTTY